MANGALCEGELLARDRFCGACGQKIQAVAAAQPQVASAKAGVARPSVSTSGRQCYSGGKICLPSAPSGSGTTLTASFTSSGA